MAIFPSAVSIDSDLFIAKNGLGTLLSSSIDNAVTTIPVTSTTGFPTVGYIVIDSEVIKYTSTDATNFLSCTRASDGTSASSHTTGAAVKANAVANHHNALKEEIKAIEQNLSDRIGLHATDVVLQANLNANSKKISSLAAATTNGDAVRYEQLFGQFLPLGGGIVTGASTIQQSLFVELNGDSTTQGVILKLNNRQNANDRAWNFLVGKGTDTEWGSYGLRIYPYNTGSSGDFVIATGSGDTRFGNGSAVIADAPTNFTQYAQLSSAGCSFKGTTTNDSATAGFIGEYVESITSANTNASATDVWDDLASISLTAGDWDVSAIMFWQPNGATWSGVNMGISTTSGNSTTGLLNGINRGNNSWASSSSTPLNLTTSIPSYRFSFASTTTVYLKRAATFSAGTPRTGGGSISARRVR